jgi:predicted metal-dependent hydrolase
MLKQYKDISYTLTRRKRKTASIYVERNGDISVFVPETLTDDEIDRLIEEKRGWIYKNLAEWQDLNATRNERDYVNGEGFLYLGRSYRIKLVEHQQMPLVLKNGYFCLRTDGRMKMDAQTAFKEFYREKGKIRIPQRVSYYQR